MAKKSVQVEEAGRLTAENVGRGIVIAAGKIPMFAVRAGQPNAVQAVRAAMLAMGATETEIERVTREFELWQA